MTKKKNTPIYEYEIILKIKCVGTGRNQQEALESLIDIDHRRYIDLEEETPFKIFSIKRTRKLDEDEVKSWNRYGGY